MTTRNVRKVAEKVLKACNHPAWKNQPIAFMTGTVGGETHVVKFADLRLLAEFVKEKTKC